MPGIREVAERARVSLGTVSNVLNHPELVAEGTRIRVQAVIEELGFIRNGSAHQLRAGHSQHIGLVVLDVANPFFTDVARGVEDMANEAGYVVILCNSDDSMEKENRYLRMLEEQRTQGILITPVQNDVGYLQRLRQRGIAIVLLDRPSRARDLCSVRCIGFVSGPLSIRQCAERRRGLRRAVKTAGLDPDQIIVDLPVAAQNVRSGEDCVEKFLSCKPRPTAVFCANDLLALGMMRGLTKHGVSIPGDLALVGYDDVEFASVLSPSLTSIRQPRYQIGRAAAELLLSEANDQADHQHQQIVYKPELIIRASSM